MNKRRYRDFFFEIYFPRGFISKYAEIKQFLTQTKNNTDRVLTFSKR